MKNWSNYSRYKETKHYESRFNEKEMGISNIQKTEIDLNNEKDNLIETVQRFKINKYARIKIISNSK